MGKHPVSVLLDLLFPPRCAFCGRLVEEGDVCAACAEALPFREGTASVQVIGEGRYPCALAFYYEGPVRDGVRALKFGKKSWRARVFARYIAGLTRCPSSLSASAGILKEASTRPAS